MRLRGLVLALTLLWVGLPSYLRAADPPPGQGFEISPTLIELRGDPGQRVSGTIRLHNITKDTLVARAEVNDFLAKGEEGQPRILLEKDETSPYSMKSWIQVPSTTLAAGEAKTTTFTVNIPAGASPGGHYSVVRFTALPPDVEGSGVALAPSVGTLVLLQVSGQVREQLRFEEFFAQKGAQKGGLFETGPLKIVERLKNTGSVHVKPTGTLTVKNWLGRKIFTAAVNDAGRNVLPDSVRRFEQQLERKNLFGRYTAETVLSYGQGKTLVSPTLVIWVIPWKLILLLLAVLLALWYLLRSGLKRYNAYVIRKSRQ
jgi:hypothetical protein